MSGSIAVIGGTGVDELEGLEVVASHLPETPFGEPSRPIQEGRLGAASVYFLQRHGSPGAIPPHRINYRANLWGLQALGVRQVVAINAVGGISDGMRPGRLVIPHQLVDYTWGREHTFDDGTSGQLQHIDFSAPFDAVMRRDLLTVASAEQIPHLSEGVYGVTQGPRLETAAEIWRMARDGCDVVGMTAMPEAALARELGLAYASICMVVNPAAGLSDEPITLDMMRDTLRREAAVVRQLLGAYLASRARA
jgi:5'-methylthioinosine phosphorylase